MEFKMATKEKIETMDLTISIPSNKYIELLTKNPSVAFVEKDIDLRFVNFNSTWLQAGNFKDKEQAIGLTDKECVWAEFADTYERYNKDVLLNKAYGTLQRALVKNNCYIWAHYYRWPKHDINGKIIGIYSLIYEITNYNIINAMWLLTQKNRYSITEYKVDLSTDDILTKREKEIVFYLCHSKSAKKIAALLGISNRTIETHICNIRSKLNCNNKDQIIDYAIAKGYVSILPGQLLGYLKEKHITTGFYQFLSGVLD